MAKGEKFYYGDESGNPVGPLSLDEIHRFAEAGVVPRDVMVCEAGGEHWRSLETLSPSAAGWAASTPTPTPTPASAEPDQSPPTAGTLKLFFWLALLASLVAFGLDAAYTLATIENDGVDPQGTGENLVMIASLAAFGLSLALVYQLVRALPGKFQFTSPWKAVVFYLIPIISLYWVFRLFFGLADSTRRWGRSLGPSQGTGLSRLLPFAGIAAFFVMLGEVLGYFDGFGAFEGENALTAERIYLLVYLGYAAAEAAFFHFMVSLVRRVGGFLDPGKFRFSPRVRSFRLAPESASWRPACLSYAFFVIVLLLWR